MSAFDAPPPALDDDALLALLNTHFGLSGSLSPLVSERDQNARLDTGDARYVVKVSNQGEDPAQIDLECQTMAHLAAAGMQGTPRPLPSRDGSLAVRVPVGDATCLMRVVSWIDGKPMSETPRTLAQLSDLGGLLGRLTHALQGFGHPAAFRPDFIWSLDHVAQLRDYADDIAEPDHRARVKALFERYDGYRGRLQTLRASVLHQDANDNNVVACADDPDRISGLVDFGDMCFGRTIHELAIALAYALLDTDDIDGACQALIEGYVAEFPITEDEADLLFDLMRMRLVCSVCISSHQSRLYPDNDYLLISRKPALALLERLDGDPARMIALCRYAAGFDPVADEAAQDAALAAAGPVLGMDLNRAALVDWSEGPLETQRPDTLPDSVPLLSLRRTGLSMGLRLPAGTPVLAPFDCEVSGTGPVTLHHATGLRVVVEGVRPQAQPGTVTAGATIAETTDAPITLRLASVDGTPDADSPLQRALFPDPNRLLKLAPERLTADPTPPAELIARRAERLGLSLSLSYRDKLKIVRGQGPWLIDHTGRHFLDGVNNITHVGHCHPHVVRALSDQAAKLNTNARYLNDGIVDLADRITAKLPGDLSVAFFVNSGTEANELALRIARTALGKKDTVVLDWAYHGNSGGMVDISPYKFKRAGGFAQPEFVQIADFPDPFRGTHRGADSGLAYAADVARCLDAVAARTGDGAATFIAESVSGVGGQVFFPDGYLSAVYDQVRARGGICIADEVQCGFGRVGSHFWGFELQGVTPDIVVMGKPIGNGHPLAAVVTTPKLAKAFANGMEYFNSFGGNPVSMAVGNAVMDVIEGENLQARALETGAYMLDAFRAMTHPLIGDVRGSGLFLGVELVRDGMIPATEEAGQIVNHMRQQGVLISTDGPDDNVLKMKPPMVFGRVEADILIATMQRAFDAL